MTVSLITYSHGLTVADLITRTEGNLYGAQRAALNQLATTATTAATTMTMADSLDGIRAGSFFEVDDEEVYVRSADTTTKVATVRRAMNGTTATQHLTDALVRVEPRFTKQRIIQALRAEIASWPLSIYARYSGSLSVASTTRGLDVAGLAGIEGAQLISAQRSPLASYETVWPTIPSARLVRRQATADFPSGYALEFPNYGGNFGPRNWGFDDLGYVQNFSAFTAQVLVKAPFSTAIFSTGTDVGQILGMPLNVAEIAPLGAAALLLMSQDSPRSDASAMGRSRASEDVHAGDATATARSLLEFRDRRIAEAAKTFLSDEGFGLQS